MGWRRPTPLLFLLASSLLLISPSKISNMGWRRPTPLLFLLASSLLLISLADAQTCDSSMLAGRSFVTCSNLGRLNAFLHWNYTASTRTVDLAFRAPQATGFVAWAINPTGTDMPGSESLVAVRNSSGGGIRSYTTNLRNKSPDMQPETLPTVGVSNLSAETSGEYMIIYAKITLPSSQTPTTTFNHIWQSSTQVSGGVPSGHSFGGDNILSKGSIDFATGLASGGSRSRIHRQNAHGIINGLAWGVLMPIGVILARYVKVFADPAWFYLHITCQTAAYGLGVAGVATGIKLGNESDGVTHKSHRAIGIALLVMATLQVLALLLRLHKDHKYRIFWTIYHRSVGYATIILGAVNIFKGFDILNPDGNWKSAYIGVLASLAGLAVLLEIVTWIVVLRRKKQTKTYGNGAADGGGYGRP